MDHQFEAAVMREEEATICTICVTLNDRFSPKFDEICHESTDVQGQPQHMSQSIQSNNARAVQYGLGRVEEELLLNTYHDRRIDNVKQDVAVISCDFCTVELTAQLPPRA